MGTQLTEAQVDRFFAQMVKGYLLKDIDTLVSRANAAPGDPVGACGYPLLMTVFSGIELLGALTSSRRFRERGVNHKYFRSYWEQFLYTSGPRKFVGKGLYPLARHGIAHAFMVKGNIVVDKTPGYESDHLTKDGDQIRIHVLVLAEDFVSSYSLWEQRYFSNHRSRVRRRLEEMFDFNDAEARRKRLLFRRLPPPTSAGAPPRYHAPVPLQPIGPEGQTITTSPSGVFRP